MEEQGFKAVKLRKKTLYVSETRYVTIHLAAIYGNLSSESGHASAITENIAGKKNNLKPKELLPQYCCWQYSHISLISIAFNVSRLYQITDSMWLPSAVALTTHYVLDCGSTQCSNKELKEMSSRP